jgi:hypothetical protein
LEADRMPRYYFTDGTTLQDPSGLDCRDDRDAEAKARMIARQIATDAGPPSRPRQIAILDEEGNQISTVPLID